MNMPNHPNSYGQICRRLSTLDIDSSSVEDMMMMAIILSLQ